MVGKLFLQNRLLPVDSVSLARLVTDMTSPQRDFYDPFPNENIDHTAVIHNDVFEVAARDQARSVGSQLTELLDLYKNRSNVQSTAVDAISAIAYELRQWDALFKRACLLPTTRKWMEDAIEEGKPVYFIVGFRTYMNPSAAELGKSSTSLTAEAQVPVSTVVSANLPGVDVGTALDPGVSWGNHRSTTLVRKFHAEGEMVYAVQYCRVKFKWYSSRKIEKSSLGPTKWKVHWGVRALEEPEDDDTVQAELSDDLYGESDLS
jgi:hypothetical protein